MTESGHQHPAEPSPDRPASPDSNPDTPPAPLPSVAVPVGGLLIVVSFFLPWVYLDHAGVSGFQLAFQEEPARVLLELLGLSIPNPIRGTRVLSLVPLLAVGVLLLDLTAGTHRMTRLISRGLIFITGLLIIAVFGYVGGSVVVLSPGPALWSTFSGGLLIVLGSAFDVVRGS